MLGRPNGTSPPPGMLTKSAKKIRRYKNRHAAGPCLAAARFCGCQSGFSAFAGPKQRRGGLRRGNCVSVIAADFGSGLHIFWASFRGFVAVPSGLLYCYKVRFC
jgi:hypothetical protein